MAAGIAPREMAKVEEIRVKFTPKSKFFMPKSSESFSCVLRPIRRIFVGGFWELFLKKWREGNRFFQHFQLYTNNFFKKNRGRDLHFPSIFSYTPTKLPLKNWT